MSLYIYICIYIIMNMPMVKSKLSHGKSYAALQLLAAIISVICIYICICVYAFCVFMFLL